MKAAIASDAPSRQPRTAPAATLLVVGDEQFARSLLEQLPGIRVRSVRAPDETHGFGVDLVLVAGAYPLSTLVDVLVHPGLSDLPVVLVAPGRHIDRHGWQDARVHVVGDREAPWASAADRVRELLRARPAEPDLQLVQSRRGTARPGARPSPRTHERALGRAPTAPRGRDRGRPPR